MKATTKYAVYEKYKESGIAWLGEVPKHWEVKRLKFCVQLTDQKMKADREKPLPYVGLENIQSWTGKLLPIDPDVVPTSAANRFGKGMTLFGKLRPYLAKACNPDFEGLCSTELLVFKSTGFDRRLLLYLLLTDGFIKTVDSSTYGAKMPRANWDFIGSCIVPVPPLEEQKQIAAFLDKETAKIDALVEKQEQLITLLREKRQAIISYAVTRGLNPNVKMKDSGIEWLGEVPEHWKVTKLGYIAKKIGSGKTPRGGSKVYLKEGILFLRSQNVHDTGLMLGKKEAVYISAEIDSEMSATRVKLGDILLNITGASIGRTCIVPANFPRANVNQHVCIIRVPENLQYYLSYFLKSVFVKSQIDAFQTGASREGLNFEQISKIVLCIPPKQEQQKIAAFLNKETTKIDTLIEKCETAIALLKERRTALIAATVTGKIDVQGAISMG